MPFGQATVSWTRNGEADLAGYRIYYGTSPTVLNNSIDVGLTATPNAPTYTFGQNSFAVYGQLYFAVAAYDSSNNESAPSTVVTKGIAPVIMPLLWP